MLWKIPALEMHESWMEEFLTCLRVSQNFRFQRPNIYRTFEVQKKCCLKFLFSVSIFIFYKFLGDYHCKEWLQVSLLYWFYITLIFCFNLDSYHVFKNVTTLKIYFPHDIFNSCGVSNTYLHYRGWCRTDFITATATLFLTIKMCTDFTIDVI